MRSVHVIIGTTGDGPADRRDWPVAAFTTKARAETFKDRANDWLRANGAHEDATSRRVPGSIEWRAQIKATNPYDPNMDLDFGGADYERVQVFLDPPLPTKDQGA